MDDAVRLTEALAEQLGGLAGTPAARALAWGVQSLLLREGSAHGFVTAVDTGRGRFDDRRARDETDIEITCA